MVVDAAHSQVFVSSPTTGKITALGYDGTVLGTITGEAGPGSMVIIGNKLYVALRTGGAIGVIDTVTRTHTTTLGAGLVQPGPLVSAGGKLWTSTGACGGSAVQLASVDPVSGAVQPYAVDPATSLRFCADLTGSPTSTNALIAWAPGASPARLTRFDLSTGAPVIATSQTSSDHSDGRDAVVTPDGASVLFAAASPARVDQFRVSDLQADGVVYPAGPSPNGVAVTAAQGGIVATTRDGGSAIDLDIYPVGLPGLDLLAQDFGAGEVPYADAVEFSPDASRVFVVTGNGTTAHFQSVDIPLPTDGSNGELTPLSPARLLDTRDGTGGHPGPLGQAQSLDLQITGRGGVPADGVSAVVLNVTATDPTVASYLTVWPTGTAAPTASNLNFTPGATVPNLVTVQVGNGGRVSIYNNGGSVHVVADVVGFYADVSGPSGSRFHGVPPARLFDTRDGTGGVGAAKRGQGSVLQVAVKGKAGVPSGATAVVLNVTATDSTAATYVTVYPDDVGRPTASNLNVVPGQTVPNLVVARIPASGVIDFYNNAGETHLLADVVGYYDLDKSTDAGRLISGSPIRLVDTRVSSPFPGDGKVTGGSSLLIDFSASQRLSQIGGFVLNVTVTEPTVASYLTAYPGSPPAPGTSSLNFVPGLTVANAAALRIGNDGKIGFFNNAGATHLIVDLFGLFTSANMSGVSSMDAGPGGSVPALSAA
jgi:hypothetical protein